MKIREQIEVMQAYEDGKTVESQVISECVWITSERPRWDFSAYVYRVKKIPQVFQIYEEDNGHLRCCRYGESTLTYQGKIPPHLTFLCKAKEV